jgi:A/G-specific adenine glycosylase
MEKPDWPFFRESLLKWYQPDRRPMPWKAIDNPYHIWLSEIILQQTRVAQGLPYFERFVAAFPTVTELAAAEDDVVMKLWEGLGYYSRARNLLKAARMVAFEFDGEFPDTYAGLLKLPGVGPYTAAAIASFAFDRQVAVLDGNVFRILSRYTNDLTPIDTGKGKKHYQLLVDEALGDTSAKRFNQAIMDFGALVCTPKKALCESCLMAERCAAYRAGTVYERPLKEKRLKRRNRHFHYLVISDDKERTIIEQRLDKDIWQNLYQFPLLETDSSDVDTSSLATHQDWPEFLPAGELTFVKRSQPFKQQLTHQTIMATFHQFKWKAMPQKVSAAQVVKNKLLVNFAFPRLINKFFADKSLLLDLF